MKSISSFLILFPEIVKMHHLYAGKWIKRWLYYVIMYHKTYLNYNVENHVLFVPE